MKNNWRNNAILPITLSIVLMLFLSGGCSKSTGGGPKCPGGGYRYDPSGWGGIPQFIMGSVGKPGLMDIDLQTACEKLEVERIRLPKNTLGEKRMRIFYYPYGGFRPSLEDRGGTVYVVVYNKFELEARKIYPGVEAYTPGYWKKWIEEQEKQKKEGIEKGEIVGYSVVKQFVATIGGYEAHASEIGYNNFGDGTRSPLPPRLEWEESEAEGGIVKEGVLYTLDGISDYWHINKNSVTVDDLIKVARSMYE